MSNSTIEENITNGNVNTALPELKAFKRAPSLGLSQWENAAFFLVEAMLAPVSDQPGTPPLLRE